MVKGKATIQDVNWRGKVLKRGVRLWYVGTDTAKDLLYGRLMVTQPGPGYVHFSKDLPATFYPGLTAESRVPVRTARGIDYRWVNTKRSRNEPLDCTVYAIFCTHALGLHTRTHREWDRLEQLVQPRNADLFAPRPVAAAMAPVDLLVAAAVADQAAPADASSNTYLQRIQRLRTQRRPA